MMRTVIIFASKSGTAEKCSRMLSEKLPGEVKVIDIGKNPNPGFSDCDNVIIGASVRAGQIQKPIKEFVGKNLNSLKSKNVGVFLCMGGNRPQFEEYLKQNFPGEFLDSCKAKGFFGGEFNMERLGFFSRTIIKALSKGKPTPKLFEENIQTFADSFKS
ncbi:MAG: flavodoxin domain-containing protein [Mesotoga sp.]